MSRPVATRGTAGEPMVSVRQFALLAAVVTVVVVLDQLAKAVVAQTLKDAPPVDILGGVVRFDFTENTGAAFGIFRSGGVAFVVVAIVVSVGILVYYHRSAGSPLLVRLALGLILGGALGNLIDRLRAGYVIDFVDLRWWPVFNIADSCIVIGISLLVLHTLLAAGD